MNCKNFFEDFRFSIAWGIVGVLFVSLVLGVFLIFKTVSVAKNFDADNYYNSITVEGMGEVMSVADIATFSYSINESADDAATAQDAAATKFNESIEYLKSQNIEDKDIKTTNVNISPKYQWQQGVCNQFGCDGRNVLVGYEVTYSVQVKVRETEKAGTIISALTEQGIGTVGNLEFTIEDDQILKDQARESAIEDAKQRAEQIADQLGVKLVKIVGFHEESHYYPQPYERSMQEGMGGDKYMMSAPELAPGEENINSKVVITFKIK